ncbi:uracil-DNA glycosylase [Aureivirga sp. CE67]|uniref:uracil-DNA glycosylase n=1 Tax=Aureivirga sp. CE67 TaxID=1788983 RepID=UPI0018CA8557|nr:uracil-DNA glycosylase [Aureivirga sp. CE67]
MKLDSKWEEILSDELAKSYVKELQDFVTNAYNTTTIYPPKEQVFAAFDHCSFKDVKVVIIGQDPYHGPGQAHGLCFSVNENIAIPPSLINIYKEICEDLEVETPNHGNLEHWAKQGVLLLNATLTVEAGKAGSHQRKGWEKFTDAVIQKIANDKEEVVFMLWGGYAKKKGRKIDKTKHLVLESGHPSPLSANRGFWFGNKHFSKANSYLKQKGKKEIEW